MGLGQAQWGGLRSGCHLEWFSAIFGAKSRRNFGSQNFHHKSGFPPSPLLLPQGGWVGPSPRPPPPVEVCGPTGTKKFLPGLCTRKVTFFMDFVNLFENIPENTIYWAFLEAGKKFGMGFFPTPHSISCPHTRPCQQECPPGKMSGSSNLANHSDSFRGGWNKCRPMVSGAVESLSRVFSPYILLSIFGQFAVNLWALITVVELVCDLAYPATAGSGSSCSVTMEQLSEGNAN